MRKRRKGLKGRTEEGKEERKEKKGSGSKGYGKEGKVVEGKEMMERLWKERKERIEIMSRKRKRGKNLTVCGLEPIYLYNPYT